MSKSIPDDLKEEALRLYASGLSSKEVEERTGVNQHSVRRLASTAYALARANALPDWGRGAFPWLDPVLPPLQPVDPWAPTAPPQWWETATSDSTLPQLHDRVAGKVSHLIIPDTQCKDGVELDHLLWAGRYVAERQPDVVVHLGDHWDMASLSSYEKRGSRYFEGKRYEKDIAAGNRALELFEKGLGDFKPKRKVLLRGNHEDRIKRAIDTDPWLEGVIGYDDFDDIALGWEVVDYLRPIEIDGVHYSHYFYNPNTGRSYSGAVDTMLRNIGFTFTMGHQQGLRWSRRELPNGQVQIGLVAGSFYQHSEDYRGPQARSEWRGLVVKHEVAGGSYDPMFVSLDYLKARFG